MNIESTIWTIDQAMGVGENLDAAYPNSPLTVVLRGDAKALGQNLGGKTVTGQVVQSKNKPKIVIDSSDKIIVQ